MGKKFLKQRNTHMFNKKQEASISEGESGKAGELEEVSKRW